MLSVPLNSNQLINQSFAWRVTLALVFCFLAQCTSCISLSRLPILVWWRRSLRMWHIRSNASGCCRRWWRDSVISSSSVDLERVCVAVNFRETRALYIGDCSATFFATCCDRIRWLGFYMKWRDSVAIFRIFGAFSLIWPMFCFISDCRKPNKSDNV